MDKNATWKWLLLLALAIGSLAIVTPLDKKIRYGIDLMGGTSFVVQIDEQELRKTLAEENKDWSEDRLNSELKTAVSQAQANAVEVIRNRVDGLGIAEPQIYPKQNDRIVIQLPGIDEDKRRAAKESIESVAFLEFRLVHENSDQWVGEVFSKGLAPRGFRIADASRRLFVKDGTLKDEQLDRAFWMELKRFAPHTRAEFMLSKEQLRDGSTVYRPHYVETRRQLTGSALKNAMVEYGQLNEPRIALEFNSAGSKTFARVTSDYAPRGERNLDSSEGRQLAIILDGTLYSAPVIRTPILNGRAEISGMFTLPEAQRLVNVLRAGSLPAPVTLLEERTVDPTLGHDSISSGKKATIIGTGAVLVFMFIYYMVAGAIANIALLLNLLLLPLGLVLVSGMFSVFSPDSVGGASILLPTLTLPGIAGIALTIGMAVDANVLIYERMREEQAAGKKLTAVIAAGYDKAFSAIFDSNLTTLLTAVILFWQGTGPVRGYAVTLSAGIIVSMYTALVVTRMVFDLLARRNLVQHLHMLGLFKHPNFNFLAVRWPAAILSLALILGSWGLFAKKGNANFGVDFSGGAAITFDFAQKQPTDKVRDVLTASGISDATIQYQRTAATKDTLSVEVLEIRVPFEARNKVVQSLAAGLPDAKFSVLKEDSVGPQVGSELQRQAVVATLLALLGIIIYVSIRFEFPFAAGAVVALLHDVLVAVGIYCALGNQLNVSMVAALLTIIGYSVNDTIVIFDRIRENMKSSPAKDFAKVANDSLNQTLSRTLLTSFATLLSVVALLVFGGGEIQSFALLLFIGMISGVYSTIYVATPVVLFWHRSKKPAQG